MAETLDGFARRLGGLNLRARFARVLKGWALEGERYASEDAFYAAGLHRRTGQLANSISASVAEQGPTGFEYALQAGGARGGKDVRHAAIHEKGGTVLPGPGKKFLAIPMGPALTGAGVARMGPREVPDLVFIPIRGGAQAMLVKRMGRGRNASWVPWFHLVRRVDIPARPYMAPAMRYIRRGIEGDIGDTFRDAVAGGAS
jgi:hypothetical protein